MGSIAQGTLLNVIWQPGWEGICGRMRVIGGLAAKSCPTPAHSGTVACRAPLCSVYGISQAGILEYVAISFSSWERMDTCMCGWVPLLSTRNYHSSQSAILEYKIKSLNGKNKNRKKENIQGYRVGFLVPASLSSAVPVLIYLPPCSVHRSPSETAVSQAPRYIVGSSQPLAVRICTFRNPAREICTVDMIFFFFLLER